VHARVGLRELAAVRPFSNGIVGEPARPNDGGD